MTEFYPSKNNPKKLDQSYKMGLFRKGKACIMAKFHRIVVILKRGHPHLIAK